MPFQYVLLLLSPLESYICNKTVMISLSVCPWHILCSISISMFSNCCCVFLLILELIGKNAEALIRYNERNKNPSVEKITEWFRKIFSIICELMFASLADLCEAKVSFEGKHDFFVYDVPIEVKTIYPANCR
jgi:uncharacterized membrane protein